MRYEGEATITKPAGYKARSEEEGCQKSYLYFIAIWSTFCIVRQKNNSFSVDLLKWSDQLKYQANDTLCFSCCINKQVLAGLFLMPVIDMTLHLFHPSYDLLSGIVLLVLEITSHFVLVLRIKKKKIKSLARAEGAQKFNGEWRLVPLILWSQ